MPFRQVRSARARRLVLATLGSLGDLHPYLVLGRELRRRGHQVALATLAAYRSRVEAAGLEFRPVRPHLDPTAPDELARALDPATGGRYILRDVAFGHVRESFEDSRAAAEDADLIVTHPMTFGMLLAARDSGLPWVSVALAPVSFFSTEDPSVIAGLPFANRLAGMGRWVQRALVGLADRGTRGWQTGYRELEAELGLDPGPNPVIQGQHSPHLVLALFSNALATKQSDWPRCAHVTGFPFAPTRDAPPLTPELEAFLAAGPPPIVFTLGSAAVGAAGNFFAESVAAVAELGARALLLTGNDPANRPPGALPQGVLAVPYAAHSLVFPRASVIVHQGGIGTTGEAMRAGRPMLVVPFAHDQPDHARRLTRLGVARSVPRARYRADVAERELRALLDDAQTTSRAKAVAAVVRAEDGTRTACDAVERLLRGGHSTGTRSVARRAALPIARKSPV